MKKVFVVIVVVFIHLSCNKEFELKQEQSTKLSTSGAAQLKAAKQDNEELQTLVRAWAEWVYGRDFSVAPFNDPDGSLQYLDQPYSSGIFMLGGGSSEEPVNRTVTISLSKYQYVFVPLVVITITNDHCDPSFEPHGGQKPLAFYQSYIKEAFNGPKDLTLLWDGASLLSTKQKDARVNSGVWDFSVAPSYKNGCADAPALSTAYADGFWAKIPLTLGTHTLVVGGNLTFRREKFEFANIVNYTINVVP